MYFINLKTAEITEDKLSRSIPIDKKPFNFNLQTLTSWDKSVVDAIAKTKGAWCAGGAPLALYTNKPHQVNDWDVFVENDSVRGIFEEKLKNLEFQKIRTDGYLTEWEKGLQGQCKVQVISKHSVNNYDFINTDFVENVFCGFDISICQVAFNNLDYFYATPEALGDIAKKKFRLFLFSPNTEGRIVKYSDKGYVFDESSRKYCYKGKATY